MGGGTRAWHCFRGEQRLETSSSVEFLPCSSQGPNANEDTYLELKVEFGSVF